MYIKDLEINYADGGYGYGLCCSSDVKLSIERCTKADLESLRWLAQHGFGIEIVSSEALKFLQDEYNSRYKMSALTIPLEYCANDVVNTYASLFRRSNSTDGLKVTKVIYHNPATIVFWSDGTKTVVKCGKGDTYDKEKGFFIACAKKLFGNDYKAVGRMNKALEMAEDKNGR